MIQDTGLQEMLENFYPVMDKENNDVQNSDHPGVSTIENQPEMYNEASTSKIQDSSMEYTNEVIDVLLDSNDDRDYYYSDTSDLNISIITKVKAVVL